MIYERCVPAPGLEKLINCYWLIDSEGDREIHRQKIVPDGYPELILHYGDPYRINLGEGWQLQDKFLLAGQIKKHFYLENTGVSGMLGIKLQPTALHHLFGLEMHAYTDRVIPLPEDLSQRFEQLPLTEKPEHIALFDALNALFLAFQPLESGSVEMAIERIINQKGNVDIATLCEVAQCSERQLERLFKSHVGLSPKFYSRIIRLGHIFELMQQGDQSWSDLVYHSGFYDQSHFIKNFKEFTGEDPSAYGFEEENMANFHLRK